MENVGFRFVTFSLIFYTFFMGPADFGNHFWLPKQQIQPQNPAPPNQNDAKKSEKNQTCENPLFSSFYILYEKTMF